MQSQSGREQLTWSAARYFRIIASLLTHKARDMAYDLRAIELLVQGIFDRNYANVYAYNSSRYTLTTSWQQLAKLEMRTQKPESFYLRCSASLRHLDQPQQQPQRR